MTLMHWAVARGAPLTLLDGAVDIPAMAMNTRSSMLLMMR